MQVHTMTSVSAITELRKYIIRPDIKKKIYFLSVVFFVIGIIGVFTQSYILTVACFTGIAAFFLELYIISRKQMQVILKRLREIYDTDKVEGNIILEEDKIRTINFVTNGELSFSYDIMFRFVETQNYYALFTKEYQMFIVDKQQFTSQTNKQFLQLIQDKMPQLFKNREG